MARWDPSAEPPSAPQRGSYGNGVRAMRGSPRLDAVRSGHGAGGHLEETGPAHVGPWSARAPVVTHRAGEANPGTAPVPSRAHVGGHGGAARARRRRWPFKSARPPRAHTAPARRARGGSRRSLCPPLASHPSLVSAAVIGSARGRCVDQWDPCMARWSRPATAAAVTDGGIGQLAAWRRAAGGQ